MHAWDQHEHEPDAAYARFLAYRNLGPSRSLDKAYRASQGAEKRQAPGQWHKDSVAYQWVARATAWDIDNLKTHGERIVLNYVASLDSIADKLQAYLSNETTTIDNWRDAEAALAILGKIITGNAAAELYHTRRDTATADTDSAE